MNANIFNFHDIVLIITSAGALLLGAGLFFFPRRERLSNRFMAGFFFCESITNLLYLFFWHALLRPFSLQHSAPMAFVFILVSLSKGPMLYFYVLSILDRKFTLTKKEIVHLCVAPFVALLFVLCGLGLSEAVPATPFIQLDQLSYIFSAFLLYAPWCYALLCLREMSRMSSVLKGFYASENESGTAWFQLMIYGYIVEWSWRLFTELFSGYLSTVFNAEIPNIFGLISNYLGFSLFFALYFYSVSRVYNRLSVALDNVDTSSDQFSSPQNNQPRTSTDVDIPNNQNELPATDNEDHHLNENSHDYAGVTEARTRDVNEELAQCVEKITDAMNNRRIYLDHSINLERFATRIGEKPRIVSCALNTIFKISFFEFINGYRVNEAKRLLLQDEELSVNEVIEKSGFSSKSAFHRAFKGSTQMTAGQYRKANIDA